MRPSADVAEVARGYASLADPERRKAFLATLRSVVGTEGQRVAALDRLYLAEALPLLIVWGDRDPIIPVAHGEDAHRALPGSRLEIFEGVGHLPQLESPGALRRRARALPRRDRAGAVRPRRVARPLQDRLSHAATSATVDAPDRIRTCGLRLRRAALYPAELRALRRPV